jgi:tRNA pseudouridine55 synthase
VLLVDKPAGLTSYDVIRALKRRFHPSKIGHSGTLDPFATGLLVILLGRATKLQERFLNAEKQYSGEFRFGFSTDTDDLTGAPLAEERLFSWADLGGERAVCDKLLKSFTGTQLQRPPAFSAIQRGGERSYDLARAGKVVEHEPRAIEIKRLELEVSGARTLRYRMLVSKGTYVRSLARDMGALLQVGAHVQSLRREISAPFRVENAQPLEQILQLQDLKKAILPLESLAF